MLSSKDNKNKYYVRWMERDDGLKTLSITDKIPLELSLTLSSHNSHITVL